MIESILITLQSLQKKENTENRMVIDDFKRNDSFSNFGNINQINFSQTFDIKKFNLNLSIPNTLNSNNINTNNDNIEETSQNKEKDDNVDYNNEIYYIFISLQNSAKEMIKHFKYFKEEHHNQDKINKLVSLFGDDILKVNEDIE